MAEPLFAWNDVVLEYATVLSSYAMLGAAGFWLAVARPSLAGAADDAPMVRAARVAARIGLVGALLGIVLTVVRTAARAADRGVAFSAAFVRGGAAQIVLVVLLALLVGLFGALAQGRARGAWAVAAGAVIALTLRNVVQGRLVGLVNPLHVLAGGLWIGTLAVLVATVIPLAVRGELAPHGRGPALSELIARFSRLSLGAAGLLATTGVITAWRHLKYVSALWTTPYGLTFLTKLAVVASVAGVGAFNWRRVSPKLGEAPGAVLLHRSARAELALAALVLAITALLISLPAPKAPGAPDRPWAAVPAPLSLSPAATALSPSSPVAGAAH